MPLSLALPVLLVLALRADEAAGQTGSYADCVAQNCPDAGNVQWPTDWGTTDADRAIDFVCSNSAARDAVDCVCTHCEDFSDLQNWVGYQYQAGVCGAAPERRAQQLGHVGV